MGDGSTKVGEDPDPDARGYDKIVDHVMAARALAKAEHDQFLIYLLDMVLYELASRGAVRLN